MVIPMSKETQENGELSEEPEFDSPESTNNGLDELLDFKPSDELVESLADDDADSKSESATDVDGEAVEIAEADEVEEVEEVKDDKEIIADSTEEVDDTSDEVDDSTSDDSTSEETPTKEDRLRETIANLQIELGSKTTALPDTPRESPVSTEIETSSEKETIPVEPTPVQESQTVLEPIDFVNQKEFVEVFRSKEGLNNLLNKVFAGAAEHITRTLPGLINITVERQIVLQKATTDFYSENPDLMEHREYVKFVLNRVQGEHPDLGIVELLEKTSTGVRHDLALGEAASATEQDRRKQLGSKSRSFAPTKGTRRGKSRGSNETPTMADKVAELIP